VDPAEDNTENEASSQRERRVVRLVLRLLVLAALATIVASSIDVPETFGHLTGDTLVSIVAVQPLMAIALVLTGWRLALLARPKAPPIFAATKAVTLGLGFNVAIPGRLSEFIKAAYMRDNAQIPFSAALAAVVVERLADLVILGILSVTAVTFVFLEVNVWSGIAVVGVGVAAIAVLGHADGVLRRFAGWFPHAGLRTFLDQLITNAAAHVRSGRIYGALVIGIAAWAGGLGMIAGIVEMAGSIELGFGALLAIYVATSIGSVLAALPAGFGTYEAAAVLCLTEFGYTAEEALALALAMHAAQFALTVPCAALILLLERIGIASLVRTAAAALRQA
jgi:uncharacterized membrane protein YbhN (UPF0104 family)